MLPERIKYQTQARVFAFPSKVAFTLDRNPLLTTVAPCN